MSTIAMIASSRAFPVADTQCAEIGLRLGSPDDAGSAGTICYEAFKTIAEQHGFPPDFPSSDVATDLIAHLLLELDIHAIIAERDGRVVGSNFLWETDTVAGVGPITVYWGPRSRGVRCSAATVRGAGSGALTGWLDPWIRGLGCGVPRVHHPGQV